MPVFALILPKNLYNQDLRQKKHLQFVVV